MSAILFVLVFRLECCGGGRRRAYVVVRLGCDVLVLGRVGLVLIGGGCVVGVGVVRWLASSWSSHVAVMCGISAENHRAQNFVLSGGRTHPVLWLTDTVSGSLLNTSSGFPSLRCVPSALSSKTKSPLLWLLVVALLNEFLGFACSPLPCSHPGSIRV